MTSIDPKIPQMIYDADSPITRSMNKKSKLKVGSVLESDDDYVDVTRHYNVSV